MAALRHSLSASDNPNVAVAVQEKPIVHEGPKTLYDYYNGLGVTPGFANLQSQEELNALARTRASLYQEKLLLPLPIFRGADFLELGPGTAENAVVFAKWGARLTLVEPQEQCWPHIWDYLDKFDARASVVEASNKTLEELPTDRTYDFVNAEGFVQTIQPASRWIEPFSRLTKPGGFAMFTYSGLPGNLIELFHKAVHTCVQARAGLDAVEAARRLFYTKWSAITTPRAFETWVIDPLQNPMLRRKYLIDPAELCQEMYDYGFALYSCWPAYTDVLQIYWDKKVLSYGERLAQIKRFIAQSGLSFALGTKLFMGACPDRIVDEANKLVRDAIDIIDVLVDAFDNHAAAQCSRLLRRLAAIAVRRDVAANSDTERSNAGALAAALADVMKRLADDDVAGAIDICSTQPQFLASWGIPNHRPVFQKVANA